MDSPAKIEDVKKALSKALAAEWEAQGHKMSGKVVDSIEYVVTEAGEILSIEGMMYPYGNIIAAGTKKDKIPFSGSKRGKKGSGGTSMFIEALKNWVMARKNISDAKQALSIAFAIATTQKREGMPTIGSYNHSSNGMRLFWVEEAFKNNESEITDAIREMCWEILSVKFDTLIAKFNYELNHK